MKIDNSDLLPRVLQCIDIGITVEGTEGEIIYANDAAAGMIGYKSVQDLMNTAPDKVLSNLSVFDKNDRHFNLKKLPCRISVERKKRAQAIVQFQKNNSTDRKWAYIKSVPVINKEGDVAYIVNTYQDVTKNQKESERMDHFTATASHELKTPLASIKALNQLVEMKFIAQKSTGILSIFTKIDEKVNEVAKLIDDFLDSTKIRSGALEFNPEMFDFDKFVSNTIKDLQPIFFNHTITIKGETKRTLVGDPSRIRQVITNLIKNAKKYSPDANKIVVILSSTKSNVKVVVQDFGVGVEKSELSKIFDPFYQGLKKYTGKGGGLGLGLYISSHIVKMHGGTMSAKSKVGLGSSFFFTLPNRPRKSKANTSF